MKIEFPPISVADGQNWGIAFPVEVDGVRRRCLIYDEAIQDLFQVKTGDLEQLRSVFEQHRAVVEALVREQIRPGEDGEIRIFKENV